jgi:HSP20 family protein
MEESGEGGRWLLRERRFGSFERTVSLPALVNAEDAAADFKDGVLTISLPKADVAKPRSIPVSGATSSASSTASAEPTEVEVHDASQQQGEEQVKG